MTADDASALRGVFCHPAVMASFGEPPFTRAQMARWVVRRPS